MALDECWSCDYTHEVPGFIQGHIFLKTRRKKGPFECVSNLQVHHFLRSLIAVPQQFGYYMVCSPPYMPFKLLDTFVPHKSKYFPQAVISELLKGYSGLRYPNRPCQLPHPFKFTIT